MKRFPRGSRAEWTELMAGPEGHGNVSGLCGKFKKPLALIFFVYIDN